MSRPQEEKPSGSIPTQAPEGQGDKPQLPVQVFQDLERRDENQILSEMRGEILEDLVYSIIISGRHVTNLSYAGVKEAVRRRGNVEILDFRTEETDREIRALVKVRDHENKIDVLGASAAEKAQPFAYTLAVNKAERNAFSKLIPAKWLATLVDEYLERHGRKSVQPATPKPEPGPVPLPAEILVDRATLEQLPWTPFKEGHRAGWTKSENAPSEFVEALRNSPVIVDDFTYRLSGLDGKLIARNPAKK